ncbi:hypothetical protein [Sulfitobacter sabulilitoris]|uniref:Uncharacterized protein n=1 Tax=Sulfitobacter sabulilitoris TaxID=2562655 RepID=A0A5S3PEN1_9RHOB|nr:hypothetical protein [Sulfitobacter sabulilitoris]TMM52495.1 hypothetical protein FDT80_09450 [Sulfitobacter sabulilitoris]
MDIIADILLVAGALGAGLYCLVLGRRLNRFNDLEKGVGGAVAVLSAQVDDLTKTLSAAQATAAASAKSLTELTRRAEDMSRRLELQMASLHDIPDRPMAAPPKAESKAPAPPPLQDAAGPMFTRHRTAGAA